MGKRVSCAYVRKYTADKIEDDRRKGKLDPEAARYGREAYRRYKKTGGGQMSSILCFVGGVILGFMVAALLSANGGD